MVELKLIHSSARAVTKHVLGTYPNAGAAIKCAHADYAIEFCEPDEDNSDCYDLLTSAGDHLVIEPRGFTLRP